MLSGFESAENARPENDGQRKPRDWMEFDGLENDGSRAKVLAEFWPGSENGGLEYDRSRRVAYHGSRGDLHLDKNYRHFKKSLRGHICLGSSTFHGAL